MARNCLLMETGTTWIYSAVRAVCLSCPGWPLGHLTFKFSPLPTACAPPLSPRLLFSKPSEGNKFQINVECCRDPERGRRAGRWQRELLVLILVGCRPSEVGVSGHASNVCSLLRGTQDRSFPGAKCLHDTDRRMGAINHTHIVFPLPRDCRFPF